MNLVGTSETRDILVLKSYLEKQFNQELECLNHIILEAELNELAYGWNGKSNYYSGQRDCLRFVQQDYESIDHDNPPEFFSYLQEKEIHYAFEAQRASAQFSGNSQSNEAYTKGYREWLSRILSVMEGIQGYVRDETEEGGSVSDYLSLLTKADQFADEQLAILYLDMGITLEEIKELRVPYWRELLLVYQLNLRELYFYCPDAENNPLPNFKAEAESLKRAGNQLGLSRLIEDKLLYLIHEMNGLLNQLR